MRTRSWRSQRAEGDVQPRIVFVGSFRSAARDGTIGGQAIACRRLLNSRSAEGVTWALLDSTQLSNPPPPALRRAWRAFKRIVRFAVLTLFHRPNGVLIFTSFARASLLEKGVMVAIARAARVRCVVCLRSAIPPTCGRLTSFTAKAALSRASVVVVQSPAAAADVNRLVPHKRFETAVVPNWIDADAFPVTSRTNDVRRFVYLGWLETFKGIPELLDVATELHENGETFELWLCGGGSMRTEVAERIARLGPNSPVKYLGWVPEEEKRRLLAQSDVLVHPSHSEGMPNAVLEGMAAGLAIIACRIPGVEALIGADDALLIGAGDRRGLREAMAALIADPSLAARLGARARARATANHDVERAACQLLALVAGRG